MIRARIRRKLRFEGRGDADARSERMRAFVVARRTGPVTEHVDAANAQHYEVPTAFYELVLGPRRKYSSAWWPEGVQDLATAEADAWRHGWRVFLLASAELWGHRGGDEFGVNHHLFARG